jgi:hypothetical protein
MGPLSVAVPEWMALRGAASDDAAFASITLSLLPWPDASDDGPVVLWGGDRSCMTAVGVELARGPSVDGVVSMTGRCHPSPQATMRAVRFAVQPALLDAGWLLLHASSVVIDGGAHLFLAPSGTGKSTLARRLVSAGATLLGDEVALVCAGRAAVFPFQPMAGEPSLEVPLSAIHVLRQGAPRSEPLTPAAAAAQLLAHAMVYESGHAAMRRSFELAATMADATPTFVTHVPDDDRAAAHLFAFARSLA